MIDLSQITQVVDVCSAVKHGLTFLRSVNDLIYIHFAATTVDQDCKKQE